MFRWPATGKRGAHSRDPDCYTCIAEVREWSRFACPADIEKQPDRLAERSGRTKTYYAREAILRHIEDPEDIEVAERSLRALHEGRAKTIPLEEVMKRYGTED